MITILITTLAACMASILTFFSGFGLGTLLMPIFAIFMPIDIAIASTAVVHFCNNIFKIVLTGKYADKKIIIEFGIPAIGAALLGAFALSYTSHFGEIASYEFFSIVATITPLKLLTAALMLFFALFELIPALQSLQFQKKYLLLGGLLSGFFGGFSGHQGALRSAFLTKVGISTEAFIGTNSIIAFMVDIVRITIYGFAFLQNSSLRESDMNLTIILTGLIGALVGVVIGKRYLHKVTMKSVKYLTGILLFCISIILGMGII